MEIWGGSHAADSGISTPGLDLWVYSRPHADADGGDVHYLSLCGGGVITRLILADVSGHGTAAADLARSLRTLIRRNINRKDHSHLVTALNRQFTALEKTSRFATALVATYLTSGRRLTVSNAGHPRPFLYDATKGKWSLLSNRADTMSDRRVNLPFGIDDEVPYLQEEITLGKGDLLLFYTDALIEGTDRAGQPLGESGLLDLVRSLDVSEPAGLAHALVDALDRYGDGKPPDDDLTFLLLRHHARRPPRRSIRQVFDVYAKVFGLKRV
jgi:serine phosphatase RsbU (regulator of sigma subunit)